MSHMSQDYIKTEYGIMPVPEGFDEVEYLSDSFFKVKKEGMYGTCNPIGKIIVEAKYKRLDLLESSFIVADNDKTVDIFNHRGEIILKGLKGFVCSIIAINKYLFLYFGEDTILYNHKGELLWRIDLPLSKVSKFEDESFCCYLKTQSKDWKVGVLSIDGKVIIPNEYKNIEYEKGFFKAEYTFSFFEKNVYRIFDIHGHLLFDDEYKKFSRISILENGIIAEEAAYNNDGELFLYDFSGRVLISAKDIVPTGNGMFVVGTWNKKQRRCCDGVIDLCGNEVLPCIYHRIEAYKDGYFYISRNSYGRYKGKLDEKYINCEGVRKLSLSGNIEVQNGENSLWLPSDYSWGTDYVKGLAIVCSNSGVGVIDTKFNTIINAYYSSVVLLDNNTILLNSIGNENSCQGIVDWSGNVIIPTQFSKIKQIKEDRYIANREEEWCFYDDKGKLLSKDKYVVVQDFKYSYEGFDIICAVVYKGKEKITDYRTRLSQGGIISEDGTEIVPCIYDKVTLYPPHYALCVRNKVYTLVDFYENKQTSFPKLKIKHVCHIDKLGRCVYSDDCKWNGEKGEWEDGTEGILSLGGIIIPTGKYESIHLLDNGLICVGVNKHTVPFYNYEGGYTVYQNWGLLNQSGDEVIPLKYTKISDFKKGYATICQGGEWEDSEFGIRLKKGKWGVINEKGEFAVECIHDSESYHDLVDILNMNKHAEKTYLSHPPRPNKILSLCFNVASSKTANTDMEYLQRNWGNDEDGSGYTREEIDRMYRDAFDNNPELEWNID